MSRRLTPKSSVDTLKREAKTWLAALKAADSAARARLERAIGISSAPPTLRQVQHALAREHGVDGWQALVAAVDAIRTQPANDSDERAAKVLARAAAAGNIDLATRALDAHPSATNHRVSMSGSGLRSALHFAVGGGHEQMVKLLLERGADPNIRDEGDNAFPLHFAAEKNDLGIIRLLVEHGADTVGDGDMHEQQVIGWATCFGDAKPDVVSYLLAHGAKHTIFSAVATGAVSDIRALVAADPALLERVMDKSNRFRRPLHLSIVKRQPESLATLIDLGADLVSRDGAGMTPLDVAALDDQRQMAEQLLAAGSAIELPAAVGLGRVDDVNRLIASNPNALRPGGKFATLIVRAAEHGSAQMIDLLVSAGASVDIEDEEVTAIDSTQGYTALHAAAWFDNRDAARALLARGASPTVRDSRYSGTPVGWATYRGHTQMAALLSAGSIDIFDAIEQHRLHRIRDIVRDDPEGLTRPIGEYLRVPPNPDYWLRPWWTPLDFANQLGRSDALTTLVELGANPLAPVVTRFLDNACPDHHVRGRNDHLRAQHTALRLLEQHPEIAFANEYMDVVLADDVDAVRRTLDTDPAFAMRRHGHVDAQRSGDGSLGDLLRKDLGPKGWDALLYLCFTRLPLPSIAEHSVDVARLLLNRGADPNSYFMAGGSRYTPLVGVIGEGEEDRPPHQCRNALVDLLLERGANPYDNQVLYNIHFKGDVLWFFERIYARSVGTGRKADWDDPTWAMLDMGGYGPGADFWLGVAVSNNDLPLARWMFDHGARPGLAPAARKATREPEPLYATAARQNFDEMATLLIRHGVERVPVSQRESPTSIEALFRAAKRNRVDGVARILDAGVSPDIADARNTRALHVAAWAGAIDVVKLLVAQGAEIDPVERNWGNTPLGCAAYSQSQSVIDFLSEYSRDVWELTQAGKVDRLRDVLSADPSRGRIEWEGETPLMWLTAVNENAAIESAKLLIAAGADPNKETPDGMTAASRAERLEMHRLAEYLADEAATRRAPPP